MAERSGLVTLRLKVHDRYMETCATLRLFITYSCCSRADGSVKNYLMCGWVGRGQGDDRIRFDFEIWNIVKIHRGLKSQRTPGPETPRTRWLEKQKILESLYYIDRHAAFRSFHFKSVSQDCISKRTTGPCIVTVILYMWSGLMSWSFAPHPLRDINPSLVFGVLCSEARRGCYGDDLVAAGLSHLVGSQACLVGRRGGSLRWLPFAGGGLRSCPIPLRPAAHTAGGGEGEGREGGMTSVDVRQKLNSHIHKKHNTHTHSIFIVCFAPLTCLQCQNEHLVISIRLLQNMLCRLASQTQPPGT